MSKLVASKPPGMYTGKVTQDDESIIERTQLNLKKKKEQRGWDLAKSPLGADLLKNVFMLWMSGSSINMFSLGMLGYLAFTPVKNMLGADKVFSPLAGDNVNLGTQRAVYMLANMLLLSLPLYKAHSLGLMPSAADFAMNTPVHIQSYLSGGDL